MSQSETETSDITDVFYRLIDDRNVFERFMIMRCNSDLKSSPISRKYISQTSPVDIVEWYTLNFCFRCVLLQIRIRLLKLKFQREECIFFSLHFCDFSSLPRARVIDYVFFCWESHEIYPHQEKCQVVWSRLVNTLHMSAVSMTTVGERSRDTGNTFILPPKYDP